MSDNENKWLHKILSGEHIGENAFYKFLENQKSDYGVSALKKMQEERNSYIHSVSKIFDYNYDSSWQRFVESQNAVTREAQETLDKQLRLLAAKRRADALAISKIRQTSSDPKKELSEKETIKITVQEKVEIKLTKGNAKPCLIKPPADAERLVGLFLPRDKREALLGDLEEEFREDILEKHSEGYALAWFWAQCIWAIVWHIHERWTTKTVIKRRSSE